MNGRARSVRIIRRDSGVKPTLSKAKRTWREEKERPLTMTRWKRKEEGGRSWNDEEREQAVK